MYLDGRARDFVAEDIEGFCDVVHVVAWDGTLVSGGGALIVSDGSRLLHLDLLGLLGFVDGLGAAIVVVLAVVVSAEGE